MSGRFITFEGLDGSGKSTHLEHAASWLAGQDVAVYSTHEPGGTDLGRAIRAAVLDPAQPRIDGRVELLLMFADRRHHLLEAIDPALAAGKVVLCDRFSDSTRAYQGHGRAVPAALIDAVDDIATGSRRPDRTLLFDLPAELARDRGQSAGRRAGVDRIDAEDLAFYERVRQGYLALAAAEPHRFVKVDAAGSREETWRQVERFLVAELALGERR